MWITLAQLDPDEQDHDVGALADWCERTGDPEPLERALATGDLLGGREPAEVPADVRETIAAALTRRIDAGA